MATVELEQIDIKPLEKYVVGIDKLFKKLYKKVDIDTQKNLEFSIYYFESDIAKLQKVFIRNSYKLSKEKNKRFVDERKNFNSDMMTSKKVARDFSEENDLIALQENVMERLEKETMTIRRLANFINNERIDNLASAKRQGV